MNRQLEKKVAIVTGAGSGIGRATALAFAEEGATVVVSDVDRRGSEETVAQIRRLKGECLMFACDVSIPSQIEELVAATVSRYGRLDIAFNNAGVSGPLLPTAELSEEAWDRVLAVNCKSVFLCMKHEIAAMQKTGGGAIVNNASILGIVGFAGASAYVASKHGILGLTKTAALEYATQGIRINAVCPGFIETPMLAAAGVTTNPEFLQQVINLEPIRRLGRPEEIAKAVVWLSSDGASFVTGHPLLVDGGYIAQ